MGLFTRIRCLTRANASNCCTRPKWRTCPALYARFRAVCSWVWAICYVFMTWARRSCYASARTSSCPILCCKYKRWVRAYLCATRKRAASLCATNMRTIRLLYSLMIRCLDLWLRSVFWILIRWPLATSSEIWTW